jgi:hypothetical protein
MKVEAMAAHPKLFESKDMRAGMTAHLDHGPHRFRDNGDPLLRVE